MKAYIKIVLLFLISFCYVNTVFEFSEIEEKSNFENENHIYIQKFENDSFSYNIAQNVTDCNINWDETILFHLDGFLSVSNECVSFYKNSFFPKRDKLFILYSSYLI